MSWFRKKPEKQPITLVPPATSRVEVELHKGATEEAAQKAQATNEHLNELLVHNGFTLKIYLAAGGRLPTKTKKG